jgi:hypothetical protein
MQKLPHGFNIIVYRLRNWIFYFVAIPEDESATAPNTVPPTSPVIASGDNDNEKEEISEDGMARDTVTSTTPMAKKKTAAVKKTNWAAGLIHGEQAYQVVGSVDGTAYNGPAYNHLTNSTQAAISFRVGDQVRSRENEIGIILCIIKVSRGFRLICFIPVRIYYIFIAFTKHSHPVRTANRKSCRVFGDVVFGAGTWWYCRCKIST